MSVESPESLEDGNYQEFQAKVRRRMSEKPFYYNMSTDAEVKFLFFSYPEVNLEVRRRSAKNKLLLEVVRR